MKLEKKISFVLLGMMMLISRPGYSGQRIATSSSVEIKIEDHHLKLVTTLEHHNTGDKVFFGIREVGARYPEGFIPELVEVSEDDINSVGRIGKNEAVQIATNLKLYPHAHLNGTQVEWLLLRARTSYRKYIDLKLSLAGDESPQAQQAIEKSLNETKRQMLRTFSAETI